MIEESYQSMEPQVEEQVSWAVVFEESTVINLK